MQKISVPYIKVKQHKKEFFLVNLPAWVVGDISYAAVRGRDGEQGAVQRVLNTRRISNIKDFAINGGFFPNSIVMNWVKKENISFDEINSKVSIMPEKNIAQLIDGQHRVEGLKEAIKQDASLMDFALPVAIYVGLTTKECADIFLAINTEQKPVQRSLVFDLYAIADEQIVDPAAVRARDIATALNDSTSPYHGMIKFPGEPPRKGGVALSTVVTAIKPLLEKNGIFDQFSLSTFENQSTAINNFFKSLQESYGEVWFERQNAFMFAAGFAGAIEFLAARLIPYCVREKSFKVETIKSAVLLSRDNLIFQKELTGKSGSEAQKFVFERLNDIFETGQSEDEFEF